MRSSIVAQAAIALLASSAAALQLPSLSSLLKREVAPGTPLYSCHEACGEVILISEAGDYCSNSTFTTDLNSCLKCALTYNIWQYYGDGVKSAAKSCSDDATPSASSATSGATSGAATTPVATTTGTSSTVTGATSATASAAATSSATASGSAASASATPGAASNIQQNAVLPLMIGAAAWALV